MPEVLVAMPRKAFVVIGRITPRPFDDLLKNQFEKAASKARDSKRPLMIHLRLHVPDVACDVALPWNTSTREDWLKKASVRIQGLLKNAPEETVGVELSALDWRDNADGSAKLEIHYERLPGPAAEPFLSELEQRRIFPTP
jgi:hypothetical protein